MDLLPDRGQLALYSSLHPQPRSKAYTLVFVAVPNTLCKRCSQHVSLAAGRRPKTFSFFHTGMVAIYTVSVHCTVEKMKVETLTPSENQSGFLARSFYLATLASGGESLKSSKWTLTFLVNSNENSHTVYFLRNRGYCTMKVWKDQNFFFCNGRQEKGFLTEQSYPQRDDYS